jgi:hypothetical protein
VPPAGPPVAIPALPTSLEKAELTEAVLLRICRTQFATQEPCFRKTKLFRFDAPDQSFGTCYAARNFKTCFVETVVRNGPLEIPKSEYDSRSVAILLVNVAKLHLVPVHGDSARGMRLDLADLASGDYRYAQALSKAVYNHPDRPDGMVYLSRYDEPSLAIVMFDRAAPHVRLFGAVPPVPLSQAPELADALRNALRFALV